MTLNSKVGALVGEREIAEFSDLDGRQIGGLVRLGYGGQLASAMVARRLRRRPEPPAGWAEFIKSCNRIT